MKSLSLFLFVVLGFVACTSGNNPETLRPKDFIPKEKMVQILADVHQAEGIISTKEFSKDSSLLLFTEIENQLFVKYGVSKKQFKDSYNYYTSHVQEYKELYTMVVDTLNVRTSEHKLQ
jgi:Domain of unknown function (DUF4296)